MNKSLKTLLASGLLAITIPAVACDYPERPTIPDGSTASKDEMLAASSQVKEYLASVDEYLTCIEDAEQAAIDEMGSPDDDAAKAEVEAEKQRRGEMLDKRFDAANEEKALVGEMFNQQVRAYNAKRKETSNGS